MTTKNSLRRRMLPVMLSLCVILTVSFLFVKEVKAQSFNVKDKVYESTVKQAYRNIVNDVAKQYPDQWYHLFDLNKDGIPELIVNRGNCEAENQADFYTYRNGRAVKIGEIAGRHRDYCGENGNNGNLLAIWAHMSGEEIERVTYDGKNFKRVEISRRMIPENEDYYTNQYEVAFYNIDDLSPLNDDDYYSSELSDWMKNSGSYQSMRYLTNDGNFPNSIIVAKNDASFTDHVVDNISNGVFGGYKGWKEIFKGTTSQAEARKILLALLTKDHKDIQSLANVKAANKLAGLYSSALKQYTWGPYSYELGLTDDERNELSKICSEDKLSELLLDSNFKNIIQEAKKSGGYTDNSRIIKVLKHFQNSKECSAALSDNLALFGKSVTVLSCSSEMVQDMYEVERLREANDMYVEMLKYIHNNCYYSPVSNSAKDIYTAIEGDQEKIFQIQTRAIRNAGEEVTVGTVNKALEGIAQSIPYFNIVKTSFKFSVSMANALFNTSDTQVQKENMRCAAYVSHCISKDLSHNWTAYNNSNNEAEKESLARSVFYLHYILTESRMIGEESLRNMMTSANFLKFKSAENKPTYQLSLAVTKTLEAKVDWLESTGIFDKFNISVISCPVDVKVYDPKGKLVFTIKDKTKINKIVKNNIYYSSNYNPIDKDYTKIIILPVSAGYMLQCVGKDLGSIDYCNMTITGNNGSTAVSRASNIPINKNSTLNVTGTTGINPKCKLLEKNKEKNIAVINNSQKYIKVKKVSFTNTNKTVTLKNGEKKLLNIAISPNNASVQTLTWKSSNSSVANVNSDGVITGVKGGNAVITAQATDGSNVIATCNIKVMSIPIKKIFITPKIKNMTVGQTAQLKVVKDPVNTTDKNKITWKSNNVKIATVTNGGLVTAKASGTTIIVANCHGKTATTTVKVVSKPTIKSISLKTNPKKLTYYQGQSLNTTGGVINVKYSNGKVVPVTITSKMCTGYNKNKLGSQKVTVTYNGHKTNFTVKVINNYVTSISVKTNPKKTTYVQGQNLNVTGGAIYVKWASGAKIAANLTSKMCTGYNKNKLGSQKVTVIYNSRKTNFTVKVINNYVTSISVKTSPKKTIYVQGQDLNVSGGVLNVNWASAAKTTANLTTKMCNGYDKNKLGRQKITVTYSGKSTAFYVTVKQDYITSISVRQKPKTITYYQDDENFIVTGGKLNVKWASGKTTIANLTKSMCTGYDENKLGTQTITVNYNRKKTSFSVKVLSRFDVNASDITQASVVLKASIPKQYVSEYGISLGTDINYISRKKSSGAGTVQNMKFTVEDLKEDTTYYYYFYYDKDGKRHRSAIKSFKTHNLILSNKKTVDEGDYYILPASAQEYGLSINCDSTADGGNVILWKHIDCYPAMTFKLSYDSNGYYKITNRNSGKCLDVDNYGTASGTNVQQWSDNGATAQRWNLVPAGNGAYYLVPKCATNRALDIQSGRMVNDSNIQIWTQNGSIAQKFILKPVLSKSRTIADGNYCILSAINSAYGLTINGNSKNDGANVHLWQHFDNELSPRTFYFRYDSDGYYEVTNKNSGKCLDVDNYGNTSGTNVQQWSKNNSTAQRWNVIPAGNGTYCLAPKNAPDKMLDVSGAVVVNGSNIQIWSMNGNNAQRFILKAVK